MAKILTALVVIAWLGLSVLVLLPHTNESFDGRVFVPRFRDRLEGEIYVTFLAVWLSLVIWASAFVFESIRFIAKRLSDPSLDPEWFKNVIANRDRWCTAQHPPA